MSSTLASKCFQARPQAVQTRTCRAAPVKALPSQERLQAAAFGVAAALLLSATPAFAGVTLEQPKLKRAFQSDDTPAAMVKKAPGDPLTKAAPAEPSGPVPKSIVEENSEGFELDARLLWPVGVAASGALLFALSKIDEGFGRMLEATLTRDSKTVGIGNEGGLKGVGKEAYSAPYYEEGRMNSVTAARMSGTKVLKKKGKK